MCEFEHVTIVTVLSSEYIYRDNEIF